MVNHTGLPVSWSKDLLRYSIRKNRQRKQNQNQDLAAAFSCQIKKLLVDRGQKKLTIAAFLPLPTEPPIRPALVELANLGHRVLVPVVEPERRLSWVAWTPQTDFASNALGIEEPLGERLGPEAFLSADLKLVPALAYDVLGRRLGQGGGYYDRLLPAEALEKERELPPHQATYVGLVFEREILDGLPAEGWDARLGHILTEKGIRSVAAENRE